MKDSPLPSPLPTPPYSSLGVQFKSVYMCVDPSIHQFLCEQKKRPYMHINLYLRILTYLHEGLNPVLSPTIHTLSSFLSTDNYAKETHSDFDKEVCQRYVYPHASLQLCPTYLISSSSSILFCFIFLFYFFVFFISLDFGF